METFLKVIHVIDAIVLVVMVLLQPGKGGGMGLAFGGGGSSSTVFGSSGAGGFMGKVTTAAAIIFGLTSLSLAYMSGRGATSIMGGAPVPSEVAPEEPGSPVTAPADEAVAQPLTDETQ